MRLLALLGLALAGCASSSSMPASTPASTGPKDPTFDADVAFLSQHRKTLVLTSPDGRGRIAVVPEFQGRVMTSGVDGGGRSYGFLKRELIASHELQKGINPYGGEDRFWIGPEGGQFSVFFPPGLTEQTLAHWQTPPLIDTEPFPLVEQSRSRARFARSARLVNASGTEFEFTLERTVEVLDCPRALSELGQDSQGLSVVAFESRNTLTNTAATPWRRETGLLSIWILGMFPPSPRCAVLLPLGVLRGHDRFVNSAYFGAVPRERLTCFDSSIGQTLWFRADGAERGKIGVLPDAARPIAGSWDAERGVLTVVSFTLPIGERSYVNSQWQARQAEPYRGDVVNTYNDGPSAPGAEPFGPFYEL